MTKEEFLSSIIDFLKDDLDFIFLDFDERFRSLFLTKQEFVLLKKSLISKYVSGEVSERWFSKITLDSTLREFYEALDRFSRFSS